MADSRYRSQVSRKRGVRIRRHTDSIDVHQIRPEQRSLVGFSAFNARRRLAGGGASIARTVLKICFSRWREEKRAISPALGGTSRQPTIINVSRCSFLQRCGVRRRQVRIFYSGERPDWQLQFLLAYATLHNDAAIEHVTMAAAVTDFTIGEIAPQLPCEAECVLLRYAHLPCGKVRLLCGRSGETTDPLRTSATYRASPVSAEPSRFAARAEERGDEVLRAPRGRPLVSHRCSVKKGSSA